MKELPTPANLHLCATHMYGAEIQVYNAGGQSLWARTNIQLEKETDEQNEKNLTPKKQWIRAQDQEEKTETSRSTEWSIP